jgi:hypothetical protein
MMEAKVLAACLMLASQTYEVPPAVMLGLYKAEGGQVGQQVPNKNGSHDLGPMQINTIWIPELAESWGVSQNTAAKWVRDDACTNMGVAAWILKNHMIETGDIKQAIAHYHSRTPRYGSKYQKRVFDIMETNGLIQIHR